MRLPDDRQLPLQIEPSSTIADVKSLVCQQLNVDFNDLFLECNGRVMNDGDYASLVQNSTIQAVLSEEGGYFSWRYGTYVQDFVSKKLVCVKCGRPCPIGAPCCRNPKCRSKKLRCRRYGWWACPPCYTRKDYQIMKRWEKRRGLEIKGSLPS